MNCHRNSLSAAAISLSFCLSSVAQAAPLTVVNVAAPAINCVFNASCTLTVNDTVATFTWPSSITASKTASASLQSRAADAAAGGVPGAGLHVYMYRVAALTGGSTDCVTGLTMDFGPVATVPYSAAGAPAQMFVVAKGGLGSVGIASADQSGNTITVKFSSAICNTVAQSSYFFGVAAKTVPMNTKVMAHVLTAPDVSVPARVATH